MVSYLLSYLPSSDIDECTSNNGGCEQLCVNLEGSHLCECKGGFTLGADGTCEDIDECSDGNGGCEEVRKILLRYDFKMNTFI